MTRPHPLRPPALLTLLALLVACGGEDDPDGLRPIDGAPYVGPGGAAVDGGSADAADATPDADVEADADRDRDGLSDAEEAALMTRFAPALHLEPSSACGEGAGLVYRVTPAPPDARLRLIRAALVFNGDCDATARVGDVSALQLLVNPAASDARDGVLAYEVVSGADEQCAQRAQCGAACASACELIELPGGARPGLLAARDALTLFTSAQRCASAACTTLLRCGTPGTRVALWMINAGEPGAPLTTDLSADGALRASAGWDARLLGYDPWSGAPFGDGPALSVALDAAPVACH